MCSILEPRRGAGRARVRHQPQLVVEMLDRALAAGVPFRYFAADAGYGRDPALRARCHAAARRQAATMSAP